MVRVIEATLLSACYAARIDTMHRELQMDLQEDLVDYIKGLDGGRDAQTAARIAGQVEKNWPAGEALEEDRRMKAHQFLYLESKIELLGDVSANWPSMDFKSGYNIRGQTSELWHSSSWGKSRFARVGSIWDYSSNATAPPAAKVSKASCHAHTYCVGQDGDCCPAADGKNKPCCDFKPSQEKKEPVEEYRVEVPGEEVVKALHEGRLLGPLKSTRCGKSKALTKPRAAKDVSDCGQLCLDIPDCKAMAFKDSCDLYSSCSTEYSNDETMLFVRNEAGMTSDLLPTRQVSGNKHHFFVVGDWGSLSCPNRDSMHYAMGKVSADKWQADHDAQHNVAKIMTTVGKRVSPFQVVNAGDNFYWGGVFHNSLGGNDIHDTPSFKQAFEDVYTDRSLMVPWLGVLGNHDYGGDGCLANVRAQFDYTIKDLLHNDRWKMPGPYYSHLVDFKDSGFTAEFFMLDSNIEDAYVGRNGGICKQSICMETVGRVIIPFEQCKAWFAGMWSEQKEWLGKAMAESKADWKILTTHHKPSGNVANAIRDLVTKHNVNLLIASHTHELGFYKQWKQAANKPLLVIGAAGGAQANPGCGNAMYCGRPHQYGFADVAMTKKELSVTIYKTDGSKGIEVNVCKNGAVKKEAC